MTPAPLTTSPSLEVRDLTRVFGVGAGAITAIDGVDLQFAVGSFTVVMGPSGSGKSTLLSLAAGLERPTSGRVLIAGVDITGVGEDARARLRRERIGFVFQGFHLMPYLSVEQNVGLPVRLAGRRPDRARVAMLLDRVGLSGLEARLPGELSGGQQQRVAIARALVTDPAVILADEPTGALDSRTAASVLALLRSCVDELGQTLVMVTHDPAAAGGADAVVFLVDGRIMGRMDRPTVVAVAAQIARLDELVPAARGRA